MGTGDPVKTLSVLAGRRQSTGSRVFTWLCHKQLNLLIPFEVYILEHPCTKGPETMYGIDYFSNFKATQMSIRKKRDELWRIHPMLILYCRKSTVETGRDGIISFT